MTETSSTQRMNLYFTEW